MKIAMIGHKRIPSREGGIEIVVEELSKRLVNLGHEVYAFNRKKQNFDTSAEYCGIKIKNIPTIDIKGIEAFIYSFLTTIVAAFGDYDILHYHAEGSCAMLWLPHLLRKRIIVLFMD